MAKKAILYKAAGPGMTFGTSVIAEYNEGDFEKRLKGEEKRGFRLLMYVDEALRLTVSDSLLPKWREF
jgi:hypothetical protein